MQIASLRPLVGGTSVIALHVVEDVPKQLWPLIWLYTQRGGGTKQFFEMVFQFVYVPTRESPTLKAFLALALGGIWLA